MVRKILKSFVGVLLSAGLVGGALVGPALAHARAITQVHTAVWEDSGVIHTEAWLDVDRHAGIMKTTLKKKNTSGDWVFVDRKRAQWAAGWGYQANFDLIAGDRVCKAVAKFTSDNHPNLKKASAPFDC